MMPRRQGGVHNSGWRRYLGTCWVLLGVGFAWWEGYHPWPSRAAHVSILVVIFLMIVMAVVVGRGRQHMTVMQWLHALRRRLRTAQQRSPLRVFGGLIWIGLALAIAGWDFHSFLLETHNLPTLSYLIGRVTRFVIGRSMMVALWFALGTYFAFGHRTASARSVGKPFPEEATRRREGDEP